MRWSLDNKYTASSGVGGGGAVDYMLLLHCTSISAKIKLVIFIKLIRIIPESSFILSGISVS